MTVALVGPPEKARTFRLLLARLRRAEAMAFVNRYLTTIVAEERLDIYADVVNYAAHFPLSEFTDDRYTAAAIVHEAAHVMVYELGGRYYGRVGELLAYNVAYALFPEILPPPAETIAENDPVHGNPVLPVRGVANV